MVSTLSFSPVFLPSLGDPDEQAPAAAGDTGTTPLFNGLLADPRFEDLRRILDGPASDETPVEFTMPGLGNHPVATVLSDTPGDERDTEATMVIPVVGATDTRELPAVKTDHEEARHRELWLPDVSAPAHPRQHA